MWYAALIGALVQVAGTFIGKALISLGIGYVAYKGIDVSVGYAKSHFLSSLQGLHPVTLQVIGVLKIGQAVNMLCSALLARLALKGMTSGTIKSMALK